MPIIVVVDVEDAIVRANDSVFGLGRSVWAAPTRPPAPSPAGSKPAWSGSTRLHTQDVDIPFGGDKQSGLGTEQGDAD